MYIILGGVPPRRRSMTHSYIICIHLECMKEVYRRSPESGHLSNTNIHGLSNTYIYRGRTANPSCEEPEAIHLEDMNTHKIYIPDRHHTHRTAHRQPRR